MMATHLAVSTESNGFQRLGSPPLPFLPPDSPDSPVPSPLSSNIRPAQGPRSSGILFKASHLLHDKTQYDEHGSLVKSGANGNYVKFVHLLAQKGFDKLHQSTSTFEKNEGAWGYIKSAPVVALDYVSMVPTRLLQGTSWVVGGGEFKHEGEFQSPKNPLESHGLVSFAGRVVFGVLSAGSALARIGLLVAAVAIRALFVGAGYAIEGALIALKYALIGVSIAVSGVVATSVFVGIICPLIAVAYGAALVLYILKLALKGSLYVATLGSICLSNKAPIDLGDFGKAFDWVVTKLFIKSAEPAAIRHRAARGGDGAPSAASSQRRARVGQQVLAAQTRTERKRGQHGIDRSSESRLQQTPKRVPSHALSGQLMPNFDQAVSMMAPATPAIVLDSPETPKTVKAGAGTTPKVFTFDQSQVGKAASSVGQPRYDGSAVI